MGRVAFKIAIEKVYAQLVEDVEENMPAKYLQPRLEGFARFMESWAASFDLQKNVLPVSA